MYKPIEFAKVLQKDGFQVLIKKTQDDNDEECPYVIEQSTVIFDEGINCNISMSIPLNVKTEEDRDKIFEEYGQKEASDFIKVLTTILDNRK